MKHSLISMFFMGYSTLVFLMTTKTASQNGRCRFFRVKINGIFFALNCKSVTLTVLSIPLKWFVAFCPSTYTPVESMEEFSQLAVISAFQIDGSVVGRVIAWSVYTISRTVTWITIAMKRWRWSLVRLFRSIL